MSLGGNSKIKTVYHKQERVLIQGYLASYMAQLLCTDKYCQRFGDGYGLNPKWIELDSKREICEKLLG